MVKSIFKALIKVPCYIMIGYLIINIVLFAIFYFRALGVSYVVMQTAVENNFIPNSEARAIYTSLNNMSSPNADGNSEMRVPIADKFAIFIDTNAATSVNQLYNKGISVNASTGITTTSRNVRRQYGKDMIVGVGYIYTAILPLNNRSAPGTGNAIDYTSKVTSTDITISYKVPGLKYYPDL